MNLRTPSGLEGGFLQRDAEFKLVELENLFQIRAIGIANGHGVGQSQIGLDLPEVSVLQFFP